MDVPTSFPTHPTPNATLKGTGLCLRSKGERNSSPPPSPTPPPPSPPSRPPPLQKPLFLTPCRVLLKHSPLLFPWPGLLKQHALHEKKRLVFKCYILKGGFFKVGAAICSDRSGLSPPSAPHHPYFVFLYHAALLEPGFAHSNSWLELKHDALRNLFQLGLKSLQYKKEKKHRGTEWSEGGGGGEVLIQTCLESRENACLSGINPRIYI